jgi:hypothetical protein
METPATTATTQRVPVAVSPANKALKSPGKAVLGLVLIISGIAIVSGAFIYHYVAKSERETRSVQNAQLKGPTVRPNKTLEELNLARSKARLPPLPPDPGIQE